MKNYRTLKRSNRSRLAVLSRVLCLPSTPLVRKWRSKDYRSNPHQTV